MREQDILVHLFEEPDFPVVPTDDNSTYLGDAVYATEDPGGENGMILWTEREGGKHWMGLDGAAIEQLYAFAKLKGLIR